MDRDALGRFIIGNTARKLDFTKEMAKHAVNQEIQLVSDFLCNVSATGLERFMETDEFKDCSILLNTMVRNAASGDLKAITWLTEMLIGKPKQQIEQKITEHLKI